MMKKIFLFLLLIISFVSYGQTYNPANFTVSNKSYGVAQAVPTDARSQFYDGTNFVMRDYQSTTEVNSYLNLAKYRTGHFLVYIHNGGSLSAGVWTGGTTDIYIYKDGVLDANLVPLFTNTTLSNTGSGFRIVKPISGSDYPLRSLASSNTIIWDSTSNSNSLTGKVDTSLIVTINRLSDTAASIRLAISAGGGGITTLTGDVTASGTGSVAATIANNAVSNAKFRQSAALSVVGRTSNSTGNVADIAAATSGHVLRRNGTTLDFGTIDSVSVPLLHSEAYYNTKYPAIGSDSVYVNNAGDSGLSLFYIQGDTLKLKRINGATQNADSSISVTGGSGGSPGGSNTQVQFNNSSAFGGDAGLTYNSTTNTVTTDSIVMNNISLQRMLRNLAGGVASDSIGFGFCVIRADATGGASSLISWSFLDDADHTKTYFTQVQGKSAGNTIHISFPDAGRLLSFVAVPDETLAGRGTFIGSSVADTAADIYVYQQIISSGYLQGNGTGWDKNGSIQNWTVNYNSGTGTISLLPPANIYYSTTEDPQSIGAAYVGSNNYRIRRMLSGLGSDIAGWRVVDIMSNTDVTGAPTTSDIVEIRGLPFYRQVNAYQVGGNLYEASIFTASANIWIMFTYKK